MLINTKLQELLKIEKVSSVCVKDVCCIVLSFCHIHSVSAMALRDTGKRKQKDSIADPISVKVLR